MTPVEALELLDRAAAAVLGNRADHAKIIEAVGVLSAVVNPAPSSGAHFAAEFEDGYIAS